MGKDRYVNIYARLIIQSQKIQIPLEEGNLKTNELVFNKLRRVPISEIPDPLKLHNRVAQTNFPS